MVRHGTIAKYVRQSLGRYQPHFDAKSASPAELAFKRDLSAQHFYQTFGDRQSQAGTFMLAASGAIRLHKGFEQPPLLFSGNADAGIRHLDFKGRVVGRKSGDDLNVALLGKLDRVAYQIEQDLP